MADLVTVFSPDDESENLMVKGLLESADIFYYPKNEAVQSLFGLGHIGSGYNLAAGPVQIQVAEGDYDKAKAIIDEHFKNTMDQSSVPEYCPACESSVNGENECPACGLVFIQNRLAESSKLQSCKVMDSAKRSFILSFFWGAGFISLIAVYYAIKALNSINEAEHPKKAVLFSLIGLILGIGGVLLSLMIFFVILL